MLDIDWTLPVALVSVIIFLVLMNRILFRPLLQLMDARQRGIQEDVEEATRLRQQAAGALATYESALGGARRELTEQALAAQRAVEARQREQIEQARQEANALVAEAQASIGRETQEARSGLAVAARDLARLVVAKLMGRQVAG
jgi:F-type H+-transporting ATPase subunit b